MKNVKPTPVVPDGCEMVSSIENAEEVDLTKVAFDGEGVPLSAAVLDAILHEMADGPESWRDAGSVIFRGTLYREKETGREFHRGMGWDSGGYVYPQGHTPDLDAGAEMVAVGFEEARWDELRFYTDRS